MMPGTLQREALVTSRLIAQIKLVELRVVDVDRALAFYGDVVGLEVKGRSDSGAELGPPGGPVVLRLTSEGVTSLARRDAAGLFHTAIRFPDRAALGDVLARLVDAQVQIGAGDHAVSEALYMDDPSGNGVELYRDRPVDEWPAPSGTMMVPMVTEPVDLHGVLAAGRGQAAVGTGAPGGTDIGHVHLQASDLDATVAFYSQTLGLDLVARMGGQAAFFSSNGYHHHIGANTWNSRGAASAPRSNAGLDAIVFGVADPEQLEKLRLRLTDAGFEADAAEGTTVVVTDPNGVELRFEPV